jgi:hypothetical protein
MLEATPIVFWSESRFLPAGGEVLELFFSADVDILEQLAC